MRGGTVDGTRSSPHGSRGPDDDECCDVQERGGALDGTRNSSICSGTRDDEGGVIKLLDGALDGTRASTHDSPAGDRRGIDVGGTLHGASARGSGGRDVDKSGGVGDDCGGTCIPILGSRECSGWPLLLDTQLDLCYKNLLLSGFLPLPLGLARHGCCH